MSATFPAATATCAALLALVFLALSGWVVALRLRSGAMHGAEGRTVLERAIRAHANFAEYVPLALLLLAALEAEGGAGLARLLGAVLVAARVVHPFGMTAPVGSLRQYALRGGAASATFAVVGAAAGALLLRAAG